MAMLPKITAGFTSVLWFIFSILFVRMYSSASYMGGEWPTDWYAADSRDSRD